MEKIGGLIKAKIVPRIEHDKKRSKIKRASEEDKTIILRYKAKELERGFVVIPKLMIRDVDLNVNSIPVYTQLKFAAAWKGITNISELLLAARTKRSVATIKTALKSLRDCGYICIVRIPNKSNIYIILVDQKDPKERLQYLLSFTPIQLWNACKYKSKYYDHKKS